MTGTTTTGSIDGKLKLDIDDFLAKVEIVKRESRALGQEHPSIDIDANTSKATAAMAAADAAAKAMGISASNAGDRVKRSATDVAAAQARVAAANEAADVAYEKARIAQLRLSEAQESGRGKASTLAAAHLAAAEALSRLEKANVRATAAESALEEAQQDAADAALRQAAAEEAAAKATDNVGNAAGRANARTQLIIGAVVALTAVAAPLTGALVGVAGGLSGLGAAGVLGIIGVVQAMKQGTQAGAQWSYTLQVLKGDMSQLAATGAANLLLGFYRSVSLINAHMPELNAQVGWFARVLGETGASALQGAIVALNVLNPLFVQGARVVQGMADGFKSWAAGGGLEKFVAYAQQALPGVVATVGDLAAAILHIAEATAPLGSAVLQVLDGIAQAINGIPVPVLTAIATIALEVYLAFMLWKGATAVFASVKASAESLGMSMKGMALAGGAVGLALTALVVVLAGVAQAQAEANARAQAYADTLDKTTGATTEASRRMAVDALNAQQGFALWQTSAFDAAKAVGISAKTMTDAYMGVPSAVKQVNDAMQKGVEQGKLTGAQADVLQSTLKQGADMASAASDAFKNNADAMGQAGDAAADATKTGQGAADAFQAEADAADEAMRKLNGLLDATNRLNGIGQSAEETNARWQKSLAGIADEVQRQKDEYERAHDSLDGFSLSLDLNSASGSANRAMLTGAAADAQAATKAQFDLDVQTMSTKDATDKYAATLAAQRQAFVDSATAAGFNADEVQKLADKVFGMPPKKELDVIANTSQASNAIQNLIQQNYVAWVQVRATLPDLNGSASGSGRPGLSYGGSIPGAANGVTARGGTVSGNGSAASDTAGLYRLAHGEEVISNVVGQADKYRSLMKAVNRNEPVANVAAIAAGMAGRPVAAPVSGGGDVYVTVQVTGVQQEDPGVLGAILGGSIKRSMAGVRK